MPLSDTQKDILRKLVKDGQVKNQNLMKELQISPSSLYYNIDSLIGLCIQRTRGGLELASKSIHKAKSAFYEKLETDRREKEDLAEIIIKSDTIDYGDTLLIDCGTTNYIIIERLIEHGKKGLNIISVNPYVLKRLLDYPEIGHIRAVGGTLNETTGAIFGPMTVQCIKEIKQIGAVIIGIDAVDQNSELGIVNEFEINQKKIMLEKAKKILVPITQRKLDRAVSHSIGNMGELKSHKTISMFISGSPSHTNKVLTKLRSTLGDENIFFTN